MRRLATVAAALTLLVSSSAAAQTSAQRFDYEVSWGYSDVARVTIQYGCERDGYRPASLTAKSLGVIDQVHAFDVRLDSFTNAHRTLEGRTRITENGVARRYTTRFAADGRLAVQKVIKNGTSAQSLSLRPNTFDLLSWFTALREQSLTSSSVHRFHVWDGWKLTEIRAVAGKMERIWTPSGTYSARRVTVSRIRLSHGDRKFQPRGKRDDVGVLWLTPSGNIPVAFDFKAPVGTAKVRLTRSTTQPCS